MSQRIKVLVADNRSDTRDLIKFFLSKDKTFRVIGEAENGGDAIDFCMDLKPDVLLIYYNISLINGFNVTETVTAELKDTIVIMYSEKDDVELVKKAMFHGAREFLITPLSQKLLNDTIKTIYNKEACKRPPAPIQEGNLNARMISVFSTKGGVGKTTIATNIAVGLYKKTNAKIIIIDLDLQFGDVLLMMNKEPSSTIIDFIENCDEYNYENLKEYLHDFEGVDILSSPSSPEFAEFISPEHINQIIEIVKNEYQYIIFDHPNSFTDTSLVALDASDTILLVSTMDVVSIKNVKVGLEVMKSLNYPSDKVKLVINKGNDSFGVKYKDLKVAFGKKITQIIVEDTKTVVTSINRGIPFILEKKLNKITMCLNRLIDQIK